MLEIIPVLENLLFSAYRVVLGRLGLVQIFACQSL